jgi:acetoin utilization protein AcuB
MWMTPDVLTVRPDEALTEVARRMASHRIRRFPVVDPQSATLVGIISASDILHAFPHDVNPLSTGAIDLLAMQQPQVQQAPRVVMDIMSHAPITIPSDAPIEAAANIMRDRKIGALPVVRNAHLVGLITESDVFRAFASVFAAPEDSARITFDISRGEDVFPLISELVQLHGLRLSCFFSLQQHQRPVCVVQVTGDEIDAMLEDVWKSHHQVVSVIRLPKMSDGA